ncbi:hypothetical protein BH11PAT3_BH11PAT3_2420 [soil metagenome]
MNKSAGALFLALLIMGSAFAGDAMRNRKEDDPTLSLVDTEHAKDSPSQIYCGRVIKIDRGVFFEVRNLVMSKEGRAIIDTTSTPVIRVHFEDGLEKILHGGEIQKMHLLSKYSMRLRPQKDGTYKMSRLFDGEDCQ